MQVFRNLEKGLLRNSSLALGVFDGIHAGHLKVIQNAVENAKLMNLTSAVVTFSHHPRLIVSGSAPGMITSLEDKLEFFRELGVDATIVLNFTEELAKLTAKEYLQKILQGCLDVKSISVGYNHKLGSDRKGSSDFLNEYCAENDIKVNIIPPVKINDHVVSSSVIRAFVTSGDVLSACNFLGRPFKLKGEVIHGQRLGRKLGFPTANLMISEDLIIPLSGVYSGTARLNTEVFNAVINIGRKPTVGVNKKLEKDLVEAHILNFDRDIYGENLEIFFSDRLRDEQKFDSLEELKVQIQLDCNTAAQYK